MPHPLAAAAALLARRWWALLPIVLLWAESFVSWPLAIAMRGEVGSFTFVDRHVTLIFSTTEAWLPRALESGGLAMLPVARAGWVSVLAPAFALLALGWSVVAPLAPGASASERGLVRGLCAVALVAGLGQLLSQMADRDTIDAVGRSWYLVAGATLRTVVVPGTLGAALLWWIGRGVPAAPARAEALGRLAVVTFAGCALLGLPESLRAAGPLGPFGRAWALAMPAVGIGAALLAAWALRPAYGRDWLGLPTVWTTVAGIAVAQVLLSGLRGAMPPVEVMATSDGKLTWLSELSWPALLLNIGVAAVQVALGCYAILALAFCAPERRR